MKHPIQQAPHSSQSGKISEPGVNFPENSPGQGQLTQISTPPAEEMRRRLVLTLEGKIIREYPIEDNNLSIGRSHGNDIQLNDMTLSGRHALISCIPDYVFIEDLGSTNGTLVNGCHIKKVALDNGDIIQIGHHQLTYLCESHVQYEPTMFIKAEHDETQFIYTENTDEKNALKGLPLGALYSAGKNDHPPMPVMELRKTYNTIGFKGKRMALITRGLNGYTITAITGTQSRRATDIPLLNGESLSDKRQKLKPGDIITIAGYDMGFYFLY